MNAYLKLSVVWMALVAVACGSSSGGTSGTSGTASSAATGANTSSSSGDAASSSSGTGAGATTGGTSGSGSSGTGGTGTSSVGTTGAFQIAAHTPLPQIPSQGGPTLSPVDLVTISFPGVALDLGGYADALLASAWIDEVGSEYGIAPGSHLFDYISDGGPSATTDADVQSLLAGLIDAGVVPVPGSGTVYVVEYPESVTITASPGQVTCQGVAGYHASFDDGEEGTVIYAVIPNCDAQLWSAEGFASVIQGTQTAVSHEVIEAATDPLGGSSPAFQLSENGATVSPYLFLGAELGDLCAFASPAELDAGLAATRVWSNAVALDGGADPCVPAPLGVPYYTVGPDPAQVVVAFSNQPTPQVLAFTLTGWSTAPLADWDVTVGSGLGTFDSQPTLSDAVQGFATINNGQTLTLTLTVPANTPSQSYAMVPIGSVSPQSGGFANLATVAVYVE